MSGQVAALYKQLLRGFDFSIGGYDNPELEISRFFNTLACNDLVAGNQSITFLMSGYAKLDNADATTEVLDLDSWKTSLLGRFNFYDYNEGYTENLLSAYLNVTNGLTRGRRATNIIADSVRSGCNIKVGFIHDSGSIVFRDNKRRGSLEVLVPAAIYREGLTSARLRELLTEYPSSERRVVQSEAHKHEYHVSQNGTSALLTQSPFLREVFRDNFELTPDGVRTLTPLTEGTMAQVRGTLNNAEANVLEIASIAIGASLLCRYFDSSIEFFVSTSHLSQGRRYSLGSIAVGVKEPDLLSDDTHAMFKILSNHLAANLSAQLVHDTNQVSRLRLQRRLQVVLLRNLMTEVVSGSNNLDHFGRAVDEDDLKNWKVFKEKYGVEDLKKAGLKMLVRHMDETFQVGRKIGKGMYTCFHDSSQGLSHYRDNKCHFYSAKPPSIHIAINGKVNATPLVNITLFNELMKVMIDQAPGITYVPVYRDNRVLVALEFKTPVSLARLLRSMMGDKDGSGRAGNLGKFFIENYRDILISGNVEIGEMDGDEFKPIVGLETDLLPILDENGVVSSLRPKYLHPDEMNLKEYHQLAYQITFKSI